MNFLFKTLNFDVSGGFFLKTSSGNFHPNAHNEQRTTASCSLKPKMEFINIAIDD